MASRNPNDQSYGLPAQPLDPPQTRLQPGDDRAFTSAKANYDAAERALTFGISSAIDATRRVEGWADLNVEAQAKRMAAAKMKIATSAAKSILTGRAVLMAQAERIWGEHDAATGSKAPVAPGLDPLAELAARGRRDDLVIDLKLAIGNKPEGELQARLLSALRDAHAGGDRERIDALVFFSKSEKVNGRRIDLLQLQAELAQLDGQAVTPEKRTDLIQLVHRLHAVGRRLSKWDWPLAARLARDTGIGLEQPAVNLATERPKSFTVEMPNFGE